jgi:hypothetical protein
MNGLEKSSSSTSCFPFSIIPTKGDKEQQHSEEVLDCGDCRDDRDQDVKCGGFWFGTM